METSMTSQDDITVAKEYHKFLNDVGDLLLTRDVKKIKRVLSTTEHFSPGEVKDIEDDQDLFALLEQKGCMGPTNIKFLQQMFDCISNEDVSKKCEEYLLLTQKQSLQGMTSQDDITVAKEYHKFLNDVGDLLLTRDVKKIKRVLSTTEHFSPGEVKDIEDDQDLFALLEQKGCMGPTNIKFLQQMFDCISNEDVSKKCEEYLLLTQKQSLQVTESTDFVGETRMIYEREAHSSSQTPVSAEANPVENEEETSLVDTTALSGESCSFENSPGHKQNMQHPMEDIQVTESTDSVGETRIIYEREAHSSSQTPVIAEANPVENEEETSLVDTTALKDISGESCSFENSPGYKQNMQHPMEDIQVTESTDSVGETRMIYEREAHSSSQTPVSAEANPVENVEETSFVDTTALKDISGESCSFENSPGHKQNTQHPIEDSQVNVPDDILDKISDQIGNNWEFIMIQLGVKKPHIDYIKENNPRNTKTQIRRCLIEWRSIPVTMKLNINVDKKFEKLQQVLRDLDRNDIVEKIVKKFKEKKDLSDSLLRIISENYGCGWDSLLLRLGIQNGVIDMCQLLIPDKILKFLQLWRDETTVTLEKFEELKNVMAENGIQEVVEFLEAHIEEEEKKNDYPRKNCFDTEVASTEEEEDLETEKKSLKVELRDYQLELAEKPLQKQNGIICAGTGSGKTYVAIHVMEDHLEKNPEGMSAGEQANMLWKFRTGELQGIVATSVVEEGIDIPKCNIVIRYDYTGNEIKAIQVKGRSRAKDGVAHVIADHRKLYREYINIEQQALMNKAIETINMMPEDNLKCKISKYQYDTIEMLNRREKEETQIMSKTEEEFSLICSCSHEIPGNAVRKLVSSNEYVLIDHEILGSVEEKRYEKKCKFDGKEKVAHMYGKCGDKWGAIFKITKTNAILYYLNISSFMVKTKGNQLQPSKDIKYSSLKIPEITEEEYRMLRSNDIPT